MELCSIPIRISYKPVLLVIKVVAALVVVNGAVGELVDVFEGFARADCHAGNRVFGDVAGNLRLVGNELVDAIEKAAAARQTDTAFRDVARELGRGTLEHGTYALKDGLQGLFQRVDHFVGANHDGLRKA